MHTRILIDFIRHNLSQWRQSLFQVNNVRKGKWVHWCVLFLVNLSILRKNPWFSLQVHIHLSFSYLLQVFSNFLPLYSYYGFSTMQDLTHFHHHQLPFLGFYLFLVSAQTFQVCSVLNPLLKRLFFILSSFSFLFFPTCLLPFSEANCIEL